MSSRSLRALRLLLVVLLVELVLPAALLLLFIFVFVALGVASFLRWLLAVVVPSCRLLLLWWRGLQLVLPF